MTNEDKDNVLHLHKTTDKLNLSDLVVDDLISAYPRVEKGLLRDIVDFLVYQGYLFDEPLDEEYLLEIDEETLDNYGVNTYDTDEEEDNIG